MHDQKGLVEMKARGSEYSYLYRGLEKEWVRSKIDQVETFLPAFTSLSLTFEKHQASFVSPVSLPGKVKLKWLPLANRQDESAWTRQRASCNES